MKLVRFDVKIGDNTRHAYVNPEQVRHLWPCGDNKTYIILSSSEDDGLCVDGNIEVIARALADELSWKVSQPDDE